jgi:hypothetical protein
MRRVQSPERSGRKMTDAVLLKEMMQRHALQRPAVPELIELDASACSPAEAAEAIQARLAALMPALRPATYRHLSMRQRT